MLNPPRTASGLAALAAMHACWALAAFVVSVHFTIGPPQQRVGIRWVPAASVAQRTAAENELSLRDGVYTDERTWSYLLRNRSHSNIARIVLHPLVEDTNHIDRTAFRVLVEPPVLNRLGPILRALITRHPSLIEFTATDELPLVALALVLLGAAIAWLHRRDVSLAIDSTIKGFGEFTRMAAARVRQRDTLSTRALLVRVLIGVVFLGPLLIYGPYEEEVIQHSIFPNQMFYAALFRGK